MGTMIGLAAIAATFLIATTLGFRAALSAYLVFALTCPHLRLHSTVVSYEIAAFPLLLAFCVVVPTRQTVFSRVFSFRSTYAYLPLWYVLLLVSTALSIGTGTGEFMGVVPVLGVMRIVLLIGIVAATLSGRHISRVFFIVLTINTFVLTYQFMFRTSVILFAELYAKPSLTPLTTYSAEGAFRRFTGTFGSPVYLGVFALVALSWYLGRALTTRFSVGSVWAIGMALACGILAVSKTSLFGIPLVLLVGLLICGSMRRPRAAIQDWVSQLNCARRRGLVLAASLAVFSAMVVWFADHSPDTSRYLTFAADPVAIFQTRYGSADTEGHLSATIEVFTGSPCIGIGFTKVDDEFLGDSVYVYILHGSGIVGASILGGLLIAIGRPLVAKRDGASLLVLFATLVSGIATNVLISPVGAMVTGFAVGEGLRPKLRCAGALINRPGETPEEIS